MNKGLYALAGVIFALVVSAIIGPFFSGLAIGLAIGYSIADKGEMLTAVWMKVHPHIDRAFARLMPLLGLKPDGDQERDNSRLSSAESVASKVTSLKDAQPASRRKRSG
jgi:hypothetical protein